MPALPCRQAAPQQSSVVEGDALECLLRAEATQDPEDKVGIY